ncbi:Imm49 family immunity protein [Streptomyces sp. A1547]|uniref:Imm49 family immunity protein n=1 Tax=Streptomyces sp. A1547 TaxID=2563105 RepID=UPI003211DF63
MLPLLPLGLAALAYRILGWAPALQTDYLPHALVTGFETRGPRVGGFGRDRRPDAVAALADALEAHREHFRVADRADDPDAAINLNVLALACHARRRGWNIRVESPYPPQRLLEAAEPF